ncbi:type IV toxin-antitoxin system AbiEi family antitoxin [Zhihengliuella sp. ISTPL4]|uniref:type IV toxin-antitoxin system AbiEi family antitoxin n=1 Tax=Zhihengliuella sp. ISTPL4 TaxID=2058657 RepID=UPI000C7B0AFF|nr:type IV toxin-antitoxin system AbiEi family antitoxin [Zhihengliuella sp. ISTPL4]
MHPALLYLPGSRLSLAELCAARLDGHVVEIGDAYIPADLPESADVRASSIAFLVQEGSAACGPTAAWIHGARDAPPAVHHVRRCVERRVRPRLHARVVFHDTAIPAREVEELGGIRVSIPVRTMCDLATGLHRDPRVLPWMQALAHVRPDTLDGAIEILRGRHRVPGSVSGVAALERLVRKR